MHVYLTLCVCVVQGYADMFTISQSMCVCVCVWRGSPPCTRTTRFAFSTENVPQLSQAHEPATTRVLPCSEYSNAASPGAARQRQWCRGTKAGWNCYNRYQCLLIQSESRKTLTAVVIQTSCLSRTQLTAEICVSLSGLYRPIEGLGLRFADAAC